MSSFNVSFGWRVQPVTGTYDNEAPINRRRPNPMTRARGLSREKPQGQAALMVSFAGWTGFQAKLQRLFAS
jgi:hypothetical protein